MDQQRGRSPSTGHQQSHISRGHSPVPQFQDNAGSVGLGLALDPALSESDQNFLNNNFNSSTTLPTFGDGNDYLTQQNQQFSSSTLGEPSFATSQDFTSQFKTEEPSPFAPPQRSFTQELLSANLGSNFNDGDFSLYSTPGQSDQFTDQSFFMNETSPQPSGNSSINPAELDMASPPAQTPPAHLQPDARTPSSAHQSPSFNPGQFQPSPNNSRSPGHSRHASLGPESAAFPQGHQPTEWSMMPPQFTAHRRSPSEYSDISIPSASHSPNLGHHDTFDPVDQNHHSPMVNPQSGLYLPEELHGINNFSLSDPQVHNGASPHHGLSPAHSPAISPRLVPQAMSNPNNSFMLGGMNNGFGQQQNMYQNQEQLPQMQQQQNGSMDMGPGPVMAPPEINVEFAPISRVGSDFNTGKPSLDQDALTPPDRGRNNRRRAVSDPYNSPSGMVRQQSPGMSPGLGTSLSPHPSDTRSLSPGDRSGTSSPNGRRRQSTSALPNRDYILGLADPEYQAAPENNPKRVQKHPATFQCTLCPKRFTRAYNLRSHLRTHTDERPFVCTVCGKAFARQHDRKRHEGLHSGEKKFVCKGELKQGGQWGCGRRFARADALGRHFRSEAGRICIKPLLDEEAIERQRLWQEQRMHNMHQPIPVDANGFPIDASGNYTLPAALLAQYPALANLTWNDMPPGDAGIDDDPSGRSSFDASGSEYYDENDEGGYVSSGAGPQQGFHQQGQMVDAYNGSYSNDIGAR
ncbi:hypothetical protein BJ875DRAFT_438769 [Amylocarpus encephaloides]|uniref:C2H2-type domain-containing protein n=1 Tax=Amylocarpus encephaloides TaxID=45428 RepID=A0A9P8C7S3_9HELO|nr:hypothetical protein BJ875DRAFT_438769 [Amylocarpus encephaloides]